jgi:multiple sugar transport system substrate-binding protein
VIRYRGLTWDHPRGFNALAAAAARLDGARDGIAIDWDKQPLEGFESHPIEDLCARYDLVVLDHPHVGDAVAKTCLVPLEGTFSSDDLATWSTETIGPCLTSYRYAGRHWALPLDAATQVMALPADMSDDPPETWDEVVAWSAHSPVALPMAGPHPVLTFFSLATAFGEPPADANPDVLVSDETGSQVLDVMATIHGRMPASARALNPIDLLHTMSTGEGAALCPLVYGYVNYTAPRGSDTRPLAFHDAPRAADGGRRGSTLGGTGIGISQRCRITPALLSHLRWLLSADAQIGFIPLHEGQPSRREAWYDEEVNARCLHFYKRTAETVNQAFVRPRYAGYIGFQTEASELLRQAFSERIVHRAVLERLQASYARTRPAGAER